MSQLERYHKAMMNGFTEACARIEQDHDLYGYPPEIVSVGLSAFDKGLSVQDAVADYMEGSPSLFGNEKCPECYPAKNPELNARGFHWECEKHAQSSVEASDEVYVRIAGQYIVCDLQESTFDDLALYCARDGGYIDQHARDSQELRRLCGERDAYKTERDTLRAQLEVSNKELRGYRLHVASFGKHVASGGCEYRQPYEGEEGSYLVNVRAEAAEARAEAAEAEVERLFGCIEEAMKEIEDDGPKALKYAAQELDKAFAASKQAAP